MKNPDLFDQPEGERLRDEGAKAAHDAAAHAWKLSARSAVHRVCMRRAEFTTDDVWEILGSNRPREPRAMAGVLAAAKRDGWCVPTDRFVKSRRAARHAGPIRVWRSLVY